MAKLLSLILLLLIMLISFSSAVYAFIAGIWQYNPTTISYFNTKLCVTSIIICIISFIVTYIILKWDEIEN